MDVQADIAGARSMGSPVASAIRTRSAAFWGQECAASVALRGCGKPNGVGGAKEGKKERIALCIHLMPVIFLGGLAKRRGGLPAGSHTHCPTFPRVSSNPQCR